MSWHCLTCTYANSASAARCEMCDTAKPQSFSVRFRTATQMFTLELHPAATVAEMKFLIESKISLPMQQQRLYYGQPRRELFGQDSKPVCQVISITDGETFQMSIEERVTSPSAASTSADNMSLDADSAGGAAAMESDFIAYLSPRGRNGAAAGHAASSASAAPVAAASTSDDFDEFDDADDGAAGGWDDADATDGGDAFFEDEDEKEELTAKAQQKKEQDAALAAKKQLQSSARAAVLCLALPQLHEMMKGQLLELHDTIGCDINEAAILSRHFNWNKERSGRNT